MQNFIEYQNIRKDYKDTTVLNNISFSIKKGEIFVLVGPSGSGKTTLLKMFNRLIEPTSGDILFKGKSIKEYKLRKLRENTGYVLQSASLFPNLTVGENITVALEQRHDISRKERLHRQKVVLKGVDLNPKLYLERMPDELSGGEAQRVGIARALVGAPETVLMDEPFSALDPVVRKQLQDLVLNLQTQFEKTIIFVTHDMQEAIRMGNQIAVVHQGNLEQVGMPREILQHPATDFVKTFFAGNQVSQKLDLETLLKSELGVDPKFYPKTETLPHYRVETVRDLVKGCSDHPDSLFIAQTNFGDFLIEPKRVWRFLLKKVANNA
ncbi:ABC transporter ATP-binding protein [Lactobacillus hominis]|uniref:ABC-type quaternary amine transporter n=1 Tax=Lactobacillus hominis DSM 23910 = CRBIP 24.179 TaxID=1423758 RepID=I7KH50_9LACO|nr:ABC transporter ATP-binding protein [Lactobacillus hominis]KRM85658.1 ABC-type proline glycine betaine transport system, ATPase component [Lactobacillus hominis DSM 23910 = CRBIP 24.179]MCT3347293.1 ABC transporter ATP-binding protein [Lactobacillus hominis]CCI81820.1 ABC-type proline/glycine betaine transport system, ATPase component [Lactobacillus hominis DSM 23910 = CRBIP 24.179]